MAILADGRPASHSVIYGTTSLWLTGTYAFDGTGNVKAIGTSSFVYDWVSRLVSSTVYTGRRLAATDQIATLQSRKW